MYDDDNDGYLDCDDPMNCQQSKECVPGFFATGVSCFQPNDCQASANDPLCLTDWYFPNFPGGYCSEWCDILAQDCLGDGVCVDLGLPSVHGVCLDGCVADDDCQPGYACVDKGYPSKVCLTPPEASCVNGADDDNDHKMDCEDPDCQSKPECASGDKAAGQPCAASNECYSQPNDPICFDEGSWGWPGGYCSEFCYFSGDCGPGSVCANYIYTPSGAGTCMRTCTKNSQCRPGYYCYDPGPGQQKFCAY